MDPNDLANLAQVTGLPAGCDLDDLHGFADSAEWQRSAICHDQNDVVKREPHLIQNCYAHSVSGPSTNNYAA
jgi:hypothetical protein